MAFGKLYSNTDNPRSIGILVAAKAGNLDLETVPVDFANITEDHRKAYQLAKVPVFVGDDGYVLHECMAIAIYITSQNEKTTLLGKTKQDYASILKWMSFGNTELVSPLGSWMAPLIGKAPYNRKNIDDAIATVEKNIAVLEAHFTKNTFLVGERITLADFFVAGNLYRGFENFFDAKWREAHPAVSRWYATIVSQPVYEAVAPKYEPLETIKLANVPPKKSEQVKPAKQPKASKPKPAKEEKKKVEEPEEEEEEEAKPASKPKHPCELLPKPSVPLDEWKRQYSNTKETAEAMKWFWENLKFDEDYSLWKARYKYNDELTQTFMSCNLIGGFSARLEASRKFTFGCSVVYGTDDDSIIQGTFVIRGQDWRPVFGVAADHENYEFTKLDPNNEADRAFVEDSWGWEKPLIENGKEYPIADGHVVK